MRPAENLKDFWCAAPNIQGGSCADASTRLAGGRRARGCVWGKLRHRRGPDSPDSPTGTPPIPVPTGDSSGRIDNPDTAADLITYNQSVNVGISVPVEGLIQRIAGQHYAVGAPDTVYVDPSIKGNCVEEALTYWQSVTGLSFAFVAAGAEPRSRCAPPARTN